MFSRKFLLATLLVCLTFPLIFSLTFPPARAQPFDYGSVRLLQTGEKSGALFFELNSPWKISWRKNTINVFPTELRWQANASSFLWPFPQTFQVFGTRSYGYEGRTALPFTTRAPIKQGEHVEVRFAACAQVCLPIETTLTAESANPQERNLIDTRLEQVPQEARQGAQQGLQITYLPVDSPEDRQTTQQGQKGQQQEEQSVLLQGRFSSEQTQGQVLSLRNPRLIVERADKTQGGLFELTALKGSHTLRFKAKGRLPRDAQKTPVRVSLLADNLPPLTLLAIPRLAPSPYESSSSHSSASTTPSLSLSPSVSLLGLLALAFLGGLMLNAMPCVFPVFAVKIASLSRADAADRKERQRRKIANKTGSRSQSSKLQSALLANALGMMLAFLLLAGVLVLAKSGGEKLGWGFQFHWPVFSGSLAALLLLLACDGWRIVALPFPAYREKVRQKQSEEQSEKEENGNGEEEKTTRMKEWSSECATGMLLTWLATPCAAPILGSALSAAVVQQTPVVFLMFALMGVGMATPLLLAAVFPHRVAKILPPPGAWSEVLRNILATAVFAASLWLFSIFAKQLSFSAASLLAASTLLVVFALRKRQRARVLPRNPSRNPSGTKVRAFASGRLVLLLASPVLVAVLLSLLPREEEALRQPMRLPSQDTTSLVWQSFAPERIADLLATENLVVVNVTADWCLSCKVNEQRVYKSAAVHERLEQLKPLVLMNADWTSHDARIASFMRKHQRYAIPFTALFVPGDEVLLLPELYGKKTFLDALAYAETLRYRHTRANTNKR